MKIIKKAGNTAWLKGLAWLLGIMLFFTVISRAADSLTVPRVNAGSPSARKLQYTVSVEGRIGKNREISVLTQPDLLVKSMLVSEGQRVQKGEVLARLDMDQLQEQIDGVEGEKKALELQNQAVKENRSRARRKQKKTLAQAKDDYARLRRENRKALAAAKKELAKARADSEPKASVEEKRKALEELRSAAEKEEKAAERAIQEAGAEPEADNSIEVNNISIRKLQGQIDKLDGLRKQKGRITAPETGVITGVLVNVGQKTQDTSLITMTDDSAGLMFQGQIMVSDARYVSVGDRIMLESADRKLEDIAVTSVEMDESREFMNVTALLPADTFSLGETVTMTAVRESESYPCTIPVKALRQDSGKSFVLTVQTEDTVLGLQEVARQEEVLVLEKNGSYAALDGESLDAESKIIIDSDRYVKAGDRVRVKDE